MSTQNFPTLIGLAYPVIRSPMWDTTVQKSISGFETRYANQTFPRYRWTVDLNVLKANASNADFQTFLGFFNQRQGMFDTFLYQDADDHTVTGQTVATGNGTTTAFQLVRTLGGSVEPVLAPNTGGTINVYLNGTKQTTGYTITGWGTTTPGILTFVTAPSNTVVITVDMSYFWPCRMDTDTLEFNLKYNQLYTLSKVAFISVKN